MMKKNILFLSILLLITRPAFAGSTQNPYAHPPELQVCMDIQTEDGGTKSYCPETLKVTNGALTDNGDGTASLNVTGSTGSIACTSVTKTSGYTLTTADCQVVGNTSGGAFTLTLPTAVGNTNVFILKRSGGSNLTIDTTAAQTIDGSSSIILTVDNTAVNVVSDGANWRIS